MICAYCNKEINVKQDYFVTFANGDILHLSCYEQREKERQHGRTNGNIQQP